MSRALSSSTDLPFEITPVFFLLGESESDLLATPPAVCHINWAYQFVFLISGCIIFNKVLPYNLSSPIPKCNVAVLITWRLVRKQIAM